MGLLSNIDDTLAKSDNTVGIMSELSLLPNSEHSFSLFKKTYLGAKNIWLYEYRFECPNILKELNDAVRQTNKTPDFNGFEINIEVCCDSEYQLIRRFAYVSYTLKIISKNGHRLTLEQYNSTYTQRPNREYFADSLFRIQLGRLCTIFANIDSIYDYLSTIDHFRGYHLYRFTQLPQI